MEKDDLVRRAIDDVANALASAVLLAAHVRRTAGAQNRDSIQLAGAVERAARALKQLRSKEEE
jgi:hypothetical protein